MKKRIIAFCLLCISIVLNTFGEESFKIMGNKLESDGDYDIYGDPVSMTQGALYTKNDYSFSSNSTRMAISFSFLKKLSGDVTVINTLCKIKIMDMLSGISYTVDKITFHTDSKNITIIPEKLNATQTIKGEGSAALLVIEIILSESHFNIIVNALMAKNLSCDLYISGGVKRFNPNRASVNKMAKGANRIFKSFNTNPVVAVQTNNNNIQDDTNTKDKTTKEKYKTKTIAHNEESTKKTTKAPKDDRITDNNPGEKKTWGRDFALGLAIPICIPVLSGDVAFNSGSDFNSAGLEVNFGGKTYHKNGFVVSFDIDMGFGVADISIFDDPFIGFTLGMTAGVGGRLHSKNFCFIPSVILGFNMGYIACDTSVNVGKLFGVDNYRNMNLDVSANMLYASVELGGNLYFGFYCNQYFGIGLSCDITTNLCGSGKISVKVKGDGDKSESNSETVTMGTGGVNIRPRIMFIFKHDNNKV